MAAHESLYEPTAEKAEAGDNSNSSNRESPGLEKQNPDEAANGISAKPDASKETEVEEAPVYATGWRLWMIMCSIFLATLCAALDLGIVATAIPGITSDFHSLDNVGWYGGIIFATVAVTAPVCGKLYKYFSGRYVYLACIVLYLVGSVLAAAAPNSIALIIGRAIQGLGVAGVLGGSALIINYVAEPAARPLLLGLWTGVQMMSTIIGPIIGGAFTTNVSWRWCFWINLPVGGLILTFVVLFIHIPKHIKPVPATWKEILLQLDIGGFVLLLASMVCYTLALQWGGQTKAWSDGSVIATLVIWIILTIAFFLLESWLGEYALMPLAHLKPRLFWTNALYGWLVNLSDFQIMYYLPIYFQSIHGQSAITSGVNTIPFVALFAVGCLVSGFLATKTGHLVPWQVVSGLLATIGCALLYTLDVDSDRARYLGPQVILGLGVGLGAQMPMTAYQFFSKPEHLQSNAGIMILTNGATGAYFITAASALFNNELLKKLAVLAPNITAKSILETGAYELADVFHGSDLTAVRQAYMTGLKDVFAFSIAGSAATVLIALMIPFKRLPGHKKETQ